jgi:cytochrome c-type biogenesis protein CcmH
MTPVPLFWLAAFALVAVTLVALLWPLLRRRAGAQDEAPEEREAATTIYRDQKRQLDADRAAGAITAQEHEAALDELASRLGAEISPRHSEPGEAPLSPERANTRAPWIAALALVATVPAAAIFAYFVLGNPAAMSPPTMAAGNGGVSEEQMRAMVDNLAQKMKANPADPKGWVLLARSYTALGRFPEAVDAYAQAAQRMPPDAQLLADWADAAAMAQGRKLAGKPAELIARALAADPTNMKALALSATSKLEGGDLAGSIAQWRELRAMLPNGSDDAREIDTVIAQLEAQRLKVGAGAATPSAAPAPSAAVAAAAATPASPVVAPASALSCNVELDPKVASRVAPDDTVFVLARAAEGPRMPLAVLRFRAAELPRAFRLDDSMSMAPGMTISTMPRVIVEARVSKSGNAITQPGDVRGVSAPVAPGAAGIRVVIGEVVP